MIQADFSEGQKIFDQIAKELEGIEIGILSEWQPDTAKRNFFRPGGGLLNYRGEAVACEKSSREALQL